jgi:broad specificity phosphatase PhoE
MRLLLIRHGQTPSNVAGILDTDEPGAPLTGLGERQAAAVPDAVDRWGVEAVRASTLQRAQQTAAPLAARLGVDVDVIDGLREIRAGDLEGLRDRASQRAYVDVAIAWGGPAGDLERRMPGGESGAEFFTRYDAAVAEAVAGHEVVAVVSHGSAIRVWASARARNLDPQFVIDHDLDNTGVVVLEGDPDGGWEAVFWTGSPLGGERLADEDADDVTGEAADRVD